MFALISVRTGLAFMLLDQMIFQVFKDISIQVNFKRMMFKILDVPKHTLTPPIQPPCCANDTLHSKAQYPTPNTLFYVSLMAKVF